MNLRNLLLATVLAGVSAFSGMAYGQDSASGGQGSGAERGHRFDFLSREEKMHLFRVRKQVFETNPELKTESESLRKEIQSVREKGSSATADDKAALRTKVRAQMEKMDAAMVKVDPTVQPILDQIKAHVRERFQGEAGGGDDSANP